MNRSSKCLVIVAGWITALAAPQAKAVDALVLDAEQRRAAGIEVSAVEPVEGATGLRWPAEVAIPPDELHVVSAPVSGVVEDIAVASADRVRAGEMMLRLRSALFLEMQREYLDALSTAALAERSYRRDADLLAEGIIPGRRAEATRAEAEQQRARLAERRHRLEMAGLGAEDLARLSDHRELASFVAVRAPMEATVLEHWVRAGQRVEIGDPLYRIGSTRRLGLEIHVPVSVGQRLVLGAPVRVLDPVARGVVVAIGAQVHAADQGILVRARLDEGGEHLRPGQLVEVDLATGGAGAAHFRFARGAITRVGDRAVVFVDGSDGLRPTEVRVVGGEGGFAIVEGALDAQSRIVTSGVASVKAVWMERQEAR